MKYAKYIDENTIAYPPKRIEYNGTIYNDPCADELTMMGYLPIEQRFEFEEIESEGGTIKKEIEPRKWYEYRDRYAVNDGKIVHTRVEVKQPKPDYEEIVNKAINEKYSMDKIISIILNGTSKPEYEKEYSDLQQFLATAKAEATADILEWELA